MLCERDDVWRVVFIVLAVLALFYLFIMISISKKDLTQRKEALYRCG